MSCGSQLYIFRVERGPFREDFYQCVTYGAYTARWQEQLYSSLSVLLMFLIPLVTLVTAYALILRTVMRKSTGTHSGKQPSYEPEHISVSSQLVNRNTFW